MKILPSYPIQFPRNFDLAPLLSFQQEVDPNLELNRFLGSCSVPLSEGIRRERQTREHDIRLVTCARNRNKTDVQYDGGVISNTISQRTLWNDVQDELGTDILPETNIGFRAIVQKIPKMLEEKLEGIELVCQQQYAVGNYASSLKRRFGMSNLNNPFRLIQADMRERGYWDSRYCYLRSILKTEGIVAVGEKIQKGWTEIFEMPTRKKYKFPPLSIQLNRELIRNKWWCDLGIPFRLLGRTGSTEVEAVVYLLSNREHRLIAV